MPLRPWSGTGEPFALLERRHQGHRNANSAAPRLSKFYRNRRSLPRRCLDNAALTSLCCVGDLNSSQTQLVARIGGILRCLAIEQIQDSEVSSHSDLRPSWLFISGCRR